MKKILEFYTTKIGHKTAALIVAVLYLILSCYLYLGPATFSCGDTLSAPPGDQSAGLIALNALDNADPWWGKTTASNAPFGEVLGSAVHVTSQTIFIPYWAVSKIVGSVCAYNVLSVAGFVFSATVMYLFVLRLLGRRSLAFLAGFAFAFTPYLVTTTGVHISYVFAGVFVLFAWAVLNFIETPTKRRAGMVGLVMGSYFYTDIYFVYLGVVWALGIIMGIVACMLMLRYFKKHSLQQILRKYRNIWVAIAVFCLLLLPIFAVKIVYSSEINSLVSSSRNDPFEEAKVYGARLREFLLPNAQQPELKSLFGDAFTRRDLHGSNTGEATLSLSLTLIVVTILGIIKYIRNPEKSDQKLKIIFLVAAVAGIIALTFSLPPLLHGLPTPTYFVVSVTTIWRVFARLHVVINLALVITAIISLWYLLRNMQPRRYWMWYIIVFLLVVFEYRTFGLIKPVWSYSRDVPSAYHWLATQTDIHRIAIYPLDEQSRTILPTYYNSYQRIHGKQTLNSFQPNSPQALLRNALRDLDAPQVAPALRTLGVDTVVVNASSRPDLPTADYRLSYHGNGITAGTIHDETWVYKVLDGKKTSVVLAPGTGFDQAVDTSPTDITYPFSRNGRLTIIPLPSSEPCFDFTSNFTISSNSATNDQDTIIEQNGHVLARTAVTTHTKTITIHNTNSPINLQILNAMTAGERISDLQTNCTP